MRSIKAVTAASCVLAACLLTGGSRLAAGQLGPAVASTVEVPGAADAFVDSIGADARFGVGLAAEGTAQDSQSRALLASGIRHLRDGYNDSDPAYLSEFRGFGGYGVYHSVGFALRSLTPSLIVSALRAQMPFVDFVEVGNEWDHSGDPLWAQHLRAAQRILYDTVRGHPEFARVLVLAPALENVFKDGATLGAVPANAGNLHNATCDFMPSTTERSIDTIAELAAAQPITPGMPIFTTETGYDDDVDSPCYISATGAAKYIPRTVAYRFNLGIRRSYFDYWSDEPPNVNGWDRMGFVTVGGAPKPQWHAVSSLIALLADPGNSFRVVPLRYALSGATANVAHTLLQKRNGAYYLLLWLEVPSWNHVTKQPLRVAPQTVTLDFAKPVGGVVDFAYTDAWSLASARLFFVSRKEITLRITDSVSILRFNTFQ